MKYARWVLAAMLLASHGFAAELLVLNKSDATLSFIDAVSGKTEATIATGAGPHEIELSNDTQLAFVSNYGASTPGSSLSVIDVKARKEQQRVDLGDLRRPHGLAFSNGKLYFTAEANQRIGRYDPGIRRVDWTFETGQEGTHMILAARDGAKLFASNMGSNSISVIERGAGDQWRQSMIVVGSGPEGLDVSPDGRELWTAHSRDGGISIIDIATQKVIHTFDAGTKRSNRLKFTPDGRWALVSDLGSGELVVIDALKRTQHARIPIGRMPTGILVTPAGQEAFVAASGDNQLVVVDLKKLRVARTIATGASPDGMAFVP